MLYKLWFNTEESIGLKRGYTCFVVLELKKASQSYHLISEIKRSEPNFSIY
jgi:hypothetical protein